MIFQDKSNVIDQCSRREVFNNWKGWMSAHQDFPVRLMSNSSELQYDWYSLGVRCREEKSSQRLTRSPLSLDAAITPRREDFAASALTLFGVRTSKVIEKKKEEDTARSILHNLDAATIYMQGGDYDAAKALLDSSVQTSSYFNLDISKSAKWWACATSVKPMSYKSWCFDNEVSKSFRGLFDAAMTVKDESVLEILVSKFHLAHFKAPLVFEFYKKSYVDSYRTSVKLSRNEDSWVDCALQAGEIKPGLFKSLIPYLQSEIEFFAIWTSTDEAQRRIFVDAFQSIIDRAVTHPELELDALSLANKLEPFFIVSSTSGASAD